MSCCNQALGQLLASLNIDIPIPPLHQILSLFFKQASLVNSGCAVKRAILTRFLFLFSLLIKVCKIVSGTLLLVVKTPGLLCSGSVNTSPTSPTCCNIRAVLCLAAFPHQHRSLQALTTTKVFLNQYRKPSSLPVNDHSFPA